MVTSAREERRQVRKRECSGKAASLDNVAREGLAVQNNRLNLTTVIEEACGPWGKGQHLPRPRSRNMVC